MFPLITEYEISYMHIIQSMVSPIISKVDSHELCKFDPIPTIFLMKCAPELAPIFSKICNNRLAGSCLPNYWNCASVVYVFKTVGYILTSRIIPQLNSYLFYTKE